MGKCYFLSRYIQITYILFKICGGIKLKIFFIKEDLAKLRRPFEVVDTYKGYSQLLSPLFLFSQRRPRGTCGGGYLSKCKGQN